MAVRMIRPQKITLTRMWLTPLVFCLLMGWVIYANQMLNPAPPLEIVLALVLGGICGVPFGILRGMHTDVRPTDRRGVMYLGSSWITLLIFVVAFGLRFAIRQVTPLRGALSGAIGDALLAFAIAFIVASYVVIFRKYQRLTA
ncbi:MAG: hypothetical protein JOZ77_12435 [Candidatus Eremiobacteraeota bacterium]|nr:hypothetical protein [Candidatus Eremiobacteraeota bacterium]